MYFGKTLSVYIYKNKRHAWVKTATLRGKLSYVSVQILYYNTLGPVAPSVNPLAPDEWTFARIESTHIVYLFPPSQGSTFSHVRAGSYSIPAVLSRLLKSFSSKIKISQPLKISSKVHQLFEPMKTKIDRPSYFSRNTVSVYLSRWFRLSYPEPSLV